MTDDVGDRIQRRILGETREKLAETERKLETVEGQVKRLADTILDKQRVMDEKIKHAEEQIALVEEKDNKINMLQRRLANLNDEMNGRGMPRMPTETALAIEHDRAKRELEGLMRESKRQFTTLEDVYKMTGESYSKDDHRS